MPPLLEDPRIRQTWNEISQNAEQATNTTLTSLYSFQQSYISPCLSSVSRTFGQCISPCFPDREERARRSRNRRGRAELSFDFYDDWEREDVWGEDELDRLLAGNRDVRKKGKSYGTRGLKSNLEADPTIIPSTSKLGFMGRLPWKVGGTLRYKPSAADLQEGVGGRGGMLEGGEPLMGEEGSDIGDERSKGKGHVRKRSDTASSAATSDSFRSRGDLFPSDEENDAIPLGDEFAVQLERRTTNSGNDDRSSGKTYRSGDRRSYTSEKSKTGSRNTISVQTKSALGGQRASSAGSIRPADTPSIHELQEEEDAMRLEEDAEVERKRQSAMRLAGERRLRRDTSDVPVSEIKSEKSNVEYISAPSSPGPSPSKVGKKMAPFGTAAAADDFVPARLPNFR